MTEYQVGSLCSLISGESVIDSGSKIIFQAVTRKSKSAEPSTQSSDVKTILKGKGRSSLQKARKFQEKIAGTLLRQRKPEIAGDNSSGADGKSWKPLPTSDLQTDSAVDHRKSTFAQNAAWRVHFKTTSREAHNGDNINRTVFVGNIPYAHADKKKLSKFFSQFGEVESCRLRCAPVKDPRISKRIAIIRGAFHKQRTSISAYVVFKSEESAKAALEANGTVYHDHHLRVDMAMNAAKEDFDPKKSIFIGNLAFTAEEEDLWETFSNCGPIESVRIVRDKKTSVAKGIGYVNFKTSDAAELALQLNGSTINNKKMVVQRYRPGKASAGKMVHGKEQGEENTLKANKKEKIRSIKKEKRRLRKEMESMQGTLKKKKMKNVISESFNGTSEELDGSDKQDHNPLKKKKVSKDDEATESHLLSGNEKDSNVGSSESTVGEKKKKKAKVSKDKKNCPLEAEAASPEVSVSAKKLKYEVDLKQGNVNSSKSRDKKQNFEGQRIEELKKKKKKKVNKGELRKKSIASLLGASLKGKVKINDGNNKKK